MLFSTWEFVIFLLLVLAGYYLVGRWRSGWQAGLLIVASYFFYAWGEPWLIFLLLASTGLNTAVALYLLDHGRTSRSRWAMVSGAVVVNLAILAFFKYAGLFAETFLSAGEWQKWGYHLSEIPLPIGISFFTFQGISLVVDVYRAGPDGIPGMRPPQTAEERRALGRNIFLFKAFFPALIAGPIVKAHEFMHQIGEKRVGGIDWEDATTKLVSGYFFKMVVADNLRDVTAMIDYPNFVGAPSFQLVLLLYAFSMQIFADFCGYSLIAMGLARLFGYQLPVNFCYPYLSASLTEFWKRWHISLSTWLKQYLYFPLGGNRKGALRTYLNLFVVMFLGGLWHGAAWSYMIWGGVHGVLLALERLCHVRGEAARFDGGFWRGLGSALRIFVVFSAVSLLWLLFKLPDFEHVKLYLAGIAALKPGLLPQPTFVIALFSLPVILFHLYGLYREQLWERLELSSPVVFYRAKMACVGLLLFLIISNSGMSGAFIYFQF
ncbi:MAG TPA: MBOAT family O-acyltransferase [Chthoniobacteraceae bacterium]|nr:MBOAT family O-acyltransferase [Chthoniobacteraceae bacterium]